MDRAFNHLVARRRVISARAALLAAALLAAPAAVQAAPAHRHSAAQQDFLTGQLLVAAPDMNDPRFDHAVILIVQHDKSGAMGIIVNRPIVRESLKELLDQIGQPSGGAKGTVTIYAGGPVQPQLGFVVHGKDYRSPETFNVDPNVAVTTSATVLQAIAHGRGPKKYIFAFGYAGWGPGQLESELQRQAWFTAPDDPKLLFDHDRATLWRTALARRSRSL